MLEPALRAARLVVVLADTTPGAPGGYGASRSRYEWRVIAANNRPLGRSAAVWDCAADCRAAAVQLPARIAESSASVGFDDELGHWQWSLVLDGRVLASGVRAHHGRDACARAARHFSSAVAAGLPLVDLTSLPTHRAAYEPTQRSHDRTRPQ